MNTINEYRIPENTSLQWRNIECDLKLRPHITQNVLYFDEIKCTGDGGLKYFFELGDWLIVVDAELVDVIPTASKPTRNRTSRFKGDFVSENASSLQVSPTAQLSLANLPCLQLNRE